MSKLMKMIHDYAEKVNSTPDGEVACENGVVEAVRSLTEPTTNRDGMVELYDNLLGYDPTTHFDAVEITDKVTKFQQEHEDMLDVDMVDNLIDSAVDIYNADRNFNQAQAIKSAMLKREDIPSSTVDEFENMFITPYITDDDDDSSLNLDDMDDDIDELDEEDEDSDDEYDDGEDDD